MREGDFDNWDDQAVRDRIKASVDPVLHTSAPMIRAELLPRQLRSVPPASTVRQGEGPKAVYRAWILLYTGDLTTLPGGPGETGWPAPNARPQGRNRAGSPQRSFARPRLTPTHRVDVPVVKQLGLAQRAGLQAGGNHLLDNQSPQRGGQCVPSLIAISMGISDFKPASVRPRPQLGQRLSRSPAAHRRAGTFPAREVPNFCRRSCHSSRSPVSGTPDRPRGLPTVQMQRRHPHLACAINCSYELQGHVYYNLHTTPIFCQQCLRGCSLLSSEAQTSQSENALSPASMSIQNCLTEPTLCTKPGSCSCTSETIFCERAISTIGTTRRLETESRHRWNTSAPTNSPP